MLCEANDCGADEELVNRIAEAICDDEEIWDIINSRIYYWLDYPDEL